MIHIFLEDILYDLPGLIYWKNKKSQYIGFNKNVVLLSGLTRESLLGKTDKELNWGQKEGDAFVSDDREVMETGVTKITEHEVPIRRPDGRLMIVRTEKSRLLDRAGNIMGVLGVAMDITEQEQLKKEIAQEKELSRKAEVMKTDFVRNMQHDIRTPFNGIWGLTDHLYRQESNAEKKALLHDISASAKELLDYCNQIVDFSKKIEDAPLLISIPEAQHKYIYERFSKLNPSNKEQYKGLGVGLSIVKKFMHDLDGDIQIESVPHKKTQFICTLAFKLPLKSVLEK